MSDTEQCLFCRIGRGEIPVTIVAETGDCLAFRDITPQAPVHVLVIPRAHVRSLNEAAGTPLVGAIIELATQVAQREGLARAGYRVVFNTNEDGDRRSIICTRTCSAGDRCVGRPDESSSRLARWSACGQLDTFCRSAIASRRIGHCTGVHESGQG